MRDVSELLALREGTTEGPWSANIIEGEDGGDYYEIRNGSAEDWMRWIGDIHRQNDASAIAAVPEFFAAIEAQAREIAAMTARAEAAEAKNAAIEDLLAVRRKMHRVNAVLQSCAMIRARLAGPTPFDAMTISDLEELYTDAATRAEAAEAKVGRLRLVLDRQASWVFAALNCKEWQWDADQREIAEQEYAEARAAIAEIGGGNG